MKRNIKAFYGLALSLSLVSGTALGWSLNPFKWIKGDDHKVYQEELEEKISTLEKQYESLVQLVGSCEINPQSEDFLKQVEILQAKLIEFVKDNHKAIPVIVRQKRDIERLYLEYPCISYRKKLSDNITDMDKTVKRYKKEVQEKNQDNGLLDKVSILLINLAVLEELLIRSNEFADECAQYSDKCAWHNNRLTDVSALTQTKPNTKVTASIS